MVVIFSFDIRGQLLVYVLNVLFAQSDHDCSSQWCMDRIVMYMAENRSLTITLCGVQGYGNHNANISMGDILGLWKSLRDHNVIPIVKIFVYHWVGLILMIRNLGKSTKFHKNVTFIKFTY